MQDVWKSCDAQSYLIDTFQTITNSAFDFYFTVQDRSRLNENPARLQKETDSHLKKNKKYIKNLLNRILTRMLCNVIWTQSQIMMIRFNKC